MRILAVIAAIAVFASAPVAVADFAVCPMVQVYFGPGNANGTQYDVWNRDDTPADLTIEVRNADDATTAYTKLISATTGYTTQCLDTTFCNGHPATGPVTDHGNGKYSVTLQPGQRIQFHAHYTLNQPYPHAFDGVVYLCGADVNGWNHANKSCNNVAKKLVVFARRVNAGNIPVSGIAACAVTRDDAF